MLTYADVMQVLFDEMARGYMAYKKADHLTLNEMLATGLCVVCVCVCVCVCVRACVYVGVGVFVYLSV